MSDHAPAHAAREPVEEGLRPDGAQDAAALVEDVDRGAERIETPCGNGRMVWRAWGRGRPVVLFHGGHGSWTHWLRNVAVLGERYRILVPDMPGYGDSDPPPEPYGVDSLAQILASGLDRVVPGGELVALVGFSFGGVMAGHVAALRRDGVRRLILLGAGGLGLPRPTVAALRNWRLLRSARDRAAAHRHNLAAIMIADPARIDDLAVHLQSENTRRTRITSRPISLTDALRHRLAEARLPLAGIWGERDAMTGDLIHTRRELLQGFDPGCPFAVVEGAGHWAQYEAPDAVNGLLLEMLEK
jgi:pimeloyl-ACP methyl ester carboxylesterase